MKGENEGKGNLARSFEELHVYQRARELTNAIYEVTRVGAFAKDYGLTNQIRRAAASVMSNIAEGFERGTSAEFIQFLYIAKGSCGEVRAQLQVALDQGYIAEVQYPALVGLARQTSGMIPNFIAHLRVSDYRGQKFTHRRPQVAEEVEQGQQSPPGTQPLSPPSHFSNPSTPHTHGHHRAG